MKILIFLYVVFGLHNSLLSQDNINNSSYPINESTLIVRDSSLTRNIIGFIPSKADKVNGWAIGYFLLSEDDLSDNKMKVINGVYSNLSPVQIYSGVYISLFSLWALFGSDVLNLETHNKSIYGKYSGKDTLELNQILNGVSLSIVDIGDRTKINGVEISVLSQVSDQMNGLSLSGLINSKTFLKGGMFGLINISESVKGFQCGLVNNCADLQGFQFGLFNRSENRIMPIINFRLKKKPK